MKLTGTVVGTSTRNSAEQTAWLVPDGRGHQTRGVAGFSLESKIASRFGKSVLPLKMSAPRSSFALRPLSKAGMLKCSNTSIGLLEGATEDLWSEATF